MSIIHVNQIKTHLIRVFENIVDSSDAGPGEEQKQNFFLTRALAAYAIQYYAEISSNIAAESITDGARDNGIDAIYYNERKKILYIVQSKWIHSGNGEPENGDVKKFLSGIRDLFDLSFERFNEKVNKQKELIKKAMSDPTTKYQIIITYTGIQDLSEPSKRDFDDFTLEMNDASEIVYLIVFNQRAIHSSLTSGVSGDPINITIGIKYWGRLLEPNKAYYGHVNGLEVASWWEQYRTRLFAKNLRGILGESDVNEEIENTISNCPENFWYFNNGLTLVCKEIEKNMIGGNDRDFGQFICKDISIVNGAQTVGTIGKYGERTKNNLEKVFVPIRIISLNNCIETFGELITKANNTQNKIENRDFVSLDTEQSRIRIELAIDGINYQVLRSETIEKNEKSFDLIESTTALACASNNVQLAVQLKREIGKLWENIEKPPYKQLFNAGVSGLYVWRCVQIQRKIDKFIDNIINITESGRDYSVAVHGNRIISFLVFAELDTNQFNNPNFKFETVLDDTLIQSFTEDYFKKLKENIDLYYKNAVIPTLFKNQGKCRDLVNKVKQETLI